MAESLALVWDLIARDNASGTFRKVGAEAEGASGAVGKLLGGFTALAVGGAVAASVAAASKFQASMLLVQTQAGATSKEVADMTPKILNLAGQVAQAPEALANSLYHVESTGLRGAQALEAVRIAAEGAKVGHADLEQTTNALTATIASGMLPATETYQQAMGQLNTIVGSGDMKMQDLNDALSTGLLVTVKQFGVTMPDVGAALADFGDNNIRGSDAATKLRMAVQAIESPSKKAAAELGRIGLTSDQLAKDMASGGLNKALTDLHDHLVNSGIDASQWGQLLTDAFTKKAGSGVLTLIGTFDRFQQKYEEVSKGADSFGNAWAATTKTASFQFSQLKDTIEAVGIKLGTKLLPPIADFAHWLSATGIPAIEQFGKSLVSAVQSTSFQSFLRDVAGLAAGAWHALQQVSGVLLDLAKTVLPPLMAVVGGVAHAFAGLSGPVQEAIVAFGLLRIAAAKGMFDGLMAGFVGVGGAFRNFGADVAATRGILIASQVPMAGFAATLSTVAERGMGALRSAGRGVMNMLGGPWMTSIALAGGAALGFSASLQKIDEAAKSVTDSLKSGASTMGAAYDTLATNQSRSITDAHSLKDAWGIVSAAFSDGAAQLQGYSSAADKAKSVGTDAYNAWFNSLDRVAKGQEAVTQATAKYNDAADKYGPASAQARDAATQLQQANSYLKHTQDDVNSATKTHIQLMQDQANNELAQVNSGLAAMEAQAQLDSAIVQYNQDTKDGQHSTAQLKAESANLATQTIDTAKAVAQHAADLAHANGVTDTSVTYQNTLHDTLVKLAGTLEDPVKQNILDAAKATEGATIKTNDFKDATGKLDLQVGQSWPNGTKVVQQATSDQIEALKQLGFHVTTLPGSDPKKPQTIWVTANTDQAYGQLSDFLKKAQDLGFVGALWNLNPIGQVGSTPSPAPKTLPGLDLPHKATGGIITGPGTATSDSIPAMLSDGEFVVNAKATSQNLSLLHSINSGAMAKFAQGGLVWKAGLAQAVMSHLNSGLSSMAAPSSLGLGGLGGSLAKVAVQAIVQQLAAQRGWGTGAEWNALAAVVNRESGWNPNAANPTSSARGLFQKMTSINGPVESTVPGQTNWGLNYIAGRYGDPLKAWAHEVSAGWYKDGIANVPYDMPAVIHKGEAVIPAASNPFSGGALEITGTLEIGGDGLARIVDGRIVQFATTATNRGAYNG